MTMLPEVQMWAAIIPLKLMEGPYPESISFPLWFTQFQVIVLT
jgi:hypothetical protein